MNPTEYIKNMLLRPGMYVRSADSLEDVYWALNCIRGTSEKYKKISATYAVKHFRTSSCPLSFHIKELNDLAIIIKEFEEEILKETTPE